MELKLEAVASGKKTAEAAQGGGNKTLFEDPAQVKREGDWWRGAGSSEFVFLKPGAPRTFESHLCRSRQRRIPP